MLFVGSTLVSGLDGTVGSQTADGPRSVAAERVNVCSGSVAGHLAAAAVAAPET